jgi:hypothetical protein
MNGKMTSNGLNTVKFKNANKHEIDGYEVNDKLWLLYRKFSWLHDYELLGVCPKCTNTEKPKNGSS